MSIKQALYIHHCPRAYFPSLKYVFSVSLKLLEYFTNSFFWCSRAWKKISGINRLYLQSYPRMINLSHKNPNPMAMKVRYTSAQTCWLYEAVSEK